MRRIIILALVVFMLVTPVFAMEFIAPDVPEAGEKYMPEDTETFWEGFRSIVNDAIKDIAPSVAEAMRVCISLFAVVFLTSILRNFTNINHNIADIVCTISVGLLLIRPSGTLINLGVQTVTEISSYGQLLLPVITAALAAQGGTTTSANLYTGTMVFNTVLSTMVSEVLVPLLYILIALCIVVSALNESILVKMKEFIKSLITCILKVIMYAFTGYIGITRVITGTVDSTAVKATKMAISGVVPVVGGILSDASETILISAGMMKNAVGIYGLLAIVAIFIEPFLRIGIQYCLLRLTASICGIFGNDKSVGLIKDFSSIMGILLALTGVVCIFFMISIVCYMKGISNV